MIRFLPLAALLAAAPALAQPFQDTAGLDRAVAAFTGHALGETGGARAAVDTRLKLAQCSTVSLSWRTEAHDSVVISCLGPEWRIFVPVIGRVADPTPAAAPVAKLAAQPPVIKRGDPVTIEAGQNGFSITREGIAMGDAPAGARVLIRVADARTPVQAVAVESGRATLPGWPD
jgi:flagellar basal body P-ring formation protein FlgA